MNVNEMEQTKCNDMEQRLFLWFLIINGYIELILHKS